MCKHKTLHYEDSGLVSYCTGCNRVKLTYGTLVLAVSPSEFRVMAEESAELSETILISDDCQKQFVLPVPASNVWQIFTSRELASYNTIIQQSLLMLDVYELLNGVSSSDSLI